MTPTAHHTVRASPASRFHRAFHGMPTAGALVGPDGAFVEANAAMTRLLGVPAADLHGLRFPDLVAASDRERVRGALAAGGGALQTTLAGLAGADVLGEVSITAIGEDPPLLYLQIADVTEQRRAEEQRAAVARDNALILDCAGDGIVRTDTAGRIVYANPAAGRLLGHAVDELVGADAHALMHHTRTDGSPYPAAASPILAAAAHGQVSRVADEVFWRKDGTSFAVDYTSAPMRDDGRITGAVCVFADISGRIAHELEAREQDQWRARIEQARRTDQFLVYS